MLIFVRGLILAVVVGLVALLGGALALEYVWPLVLAAAVAFVPGTALGGRLAAFVVGVAAGWVAFALRAGVLPDVPLGRAIFVALPVLIVAAAAAATRDRVPLWAGLVGLGTFAAMYHPVFVASPTDFMTQSVTTLTSVLLAAGIGGAAAMLLRFVPGDRNGTDAERTDTVVADPKEMSA
jgi:hypothetical protein